MELICESDKFITVNRYIITTILHIIASFPHIESPTIRTLIAD